MDKATFKKIKQAVGSQAELARQMDVTPMAVSKWKHSQIPAEKVIQVELLTGVCRSEIRPDIYPPISPD